MTTIGAVRAELREAAMSTMSTSVVDAVHEAAGAWGWSSTHRDEIHREYERFLDLADGNRGVPLVPAHEVDLVWHEHVRYAATDGDRTPPAHGTHSTPDHEARFAATVELYRARFGEPGPVWEHAAVCQVDPRDPFAPEEPPAGPPPD